MAGMSDDLTIGLLQVYLLVQHQPEVQNHLQDHYGPEIVDEIEAAVRDMDVSVESVRLAGSNPKESSKTSHNPALLMRCFAKRTLSGIQVHESLSECSKDVLIRYILNEYGYTPRPRRRG